MGDIQQATVSIQAAPPLLFPLLSPVYTLLAPMHCSSCFLLLLWRFLASVHNQWKPTAKNFMRCVVLNLCFFFFQKLMHHSHEDYAMHMPLRKFSLRWEFKEIRVSTISSNFTRNCLLEASIFCPVAREDLHRKLPWYEEYIPCGHYRGGCLATAIFYAFTPLLRIYSSLSLSLSADICFSVSRGYPDNSKHSRLTEHTWRCIVADLNTKKAKKIPHLQSCFHDAPCWTLLFFFFFFFFWTLERISEQKMPLEVLKEDVSGSLIAFSVQEEIIGKNIGRVCYWKLRFRPF